MEDNITITKQQYEQLKSHSQMLGVIGMYVEEFCQDPDDTALHGVICLLSKYHEGMADYYHHRLVSERNK